MSNAPDFNELDDDDDDGVFDEQLVGVTGLTARGVAKLPKPLTSGQVDAAHFELLLSDTRANGKKVIPALRAHLVEGLSAREAIEKYEASGSQFYARLRGLQQKHALVGSMLEFYPPVENALQPTEELEQVRSILSQTHAAAKQIESLLAANAALGGDPVGEIERVGKEKTAVMWTDLPVGTLLYAVTP